MDRRQAIASFTGTALAGLSGCLSIRRLAATEFDIGMSANAFEPAVYETEPGTTVVWLNNGSRAHTVTAYEERLPDGAEYFATGDFETEAQAREAWTRRYGGNLAQGETFAHTFDIEGTYPYFCIPHEHEHAAMVGRIDVFSAD